VTFVATSTLGDLRGADFTDIAQLDASQLEAILDLASRIKAGRWRETPLAGRSIALLFQKPSIRTRVSFDVGITRLGGHPITLQDAEVGLGQRESVQDVARVLERFVDGVVARLFSHRDLLDLAAACDIPVINGLTDVSHPCQVLADLLTMREVLGRLDETTPVAFVGDGNNVVSSLIEAASLLGFPLTVISPSAHGPRPESLARARGVTVTDNLGAVAGSAVVYTDVWTSMGQEAEAEARRRQFVEYQVNGELMSLAPKAIFMHCLPAHRGDEVTAEVIDGPTSVVFDQAANRLYAQMALLAQIFPPFAPSGPDGPPPPRGGRGRP
jgi:ornithine carbamoyltransferase